MYALKFDMTWCARGRRASSSEASKALWSRPFHSFRPPAVPDQPSERMWADLLMCHSANSP